jgi:hypothetical protein
MAKMRVKVSVGCSFLFGLLLFGGCGGDGTTEPGGAATITGQLALPSQAGGRTFVVMVDNDIDGDNGHIVSTTGICGSGMTRNYSIDDVPAGTCYVYAVMFVVSDGNAGPQDGDYVGIHGGTLFNPPSQPNVVVPSSGTVTCDITLNVM